MSVATAETALTEEPAVLDVMPDGIAPRGIALSVAFHLVLGGLFIFGLPRLFDPPTPEDMPVAVELVTIAPETRATRPNLNLPRPNAKPDIPVADAPVATPEPEPPVPSPVPPPSAEIPPSPELSQPPEPKPAPSQPLPKPEPKPEPPKPIERAEAPRPKEKPEPPQQMAKNEAKSEQKKYDPGQFDALLKNLAASEVDLIREQIARCWNVPAGARDAKDLVVEIRVAVDPDGTVRQATIVDQARLGSDPFFRAAAESARRAFFNPLCRPLRLPPDKYAIWKDLVVDFSPKDIL
jgi:outer membrane biosynthesis protein TonB